VQYGVSVGFENGKLVRVSLAAQAASGNTEVNTFHYDLQDGPLGDDNDPQSLADAFRDDVRSHFAALFDSGWTIQPVNVIQEIDPLNPTGPRSQWTAGDGTPGTKTTASSPLAPAHVAVATLHTGYAGKRHRGRVFLGGNFGEADLDFRTWQAGQLALWQALLDAIPRQPDLAPPGSQAVAHWCVYSRTQRAQSLDPYAPAVTSVTLHNALHWLRSRERI